MQNFMRPLILILLAASLLARPAAHAQLNDGKPDPDFAVPAALNLEYALAFALDNSFAIRQAKERIRQQEGVVLEVRGPLLPNISASGEYQRNDAEVGPTGENRYWAFDITA